MGLIKSYLIKSYLLIISLMVTLINFTRAPIMGYLKYYLKGFLMG